ncbi:hypothetical protein PUN28_011962 [Cardiocondyla obscurior]|uniref:Uncharacterized protein n=1 Tax=Cardiocondyla obscurior TaxID=286306 RepID=A0AAW2F8N7_9HYME
MTFMDIYAAIISRPRRDAPFRLARVKSVIEIPLLENVERSAVAAVLRGGFSLPLPRLLHRTARRGFSLVVGERERGSAGARGRCPSRRPTLSKPTRSSTHTRRFYTSSRHDGGDKRFMLARVYARRTRTRDAHAYGRRVSAATHARGPTTTRAKKTCANLDPAGRIRMVNPVVLR